MWRSRRRWCRPLSVAHLASAGETGHLWRGWTKVRKVHSKPLWTVQSQARIPHFFPLSAPMKLKINEKSCTLAKTNLQAKSYWQICTLIALWSSKLCKNSALPIASSVVSEPHSSPLIGKWLPEPLPSSVWATPSVTVTQPILKTRLPSESIRGCVLLAQRS